MARTSKPDANGWYSTDYDFGGSAWNYAQAWVWSNTFTWVGVTRGPADQGPGPLFSAHHEDVRSLLRSGCFVRV